MAPFICAVLDSLGRPLAGVRVSFSLQSAPQPQEFIAFTDADGHVTSWNSSLPHNMVRLRSHIFYDGDTIKGLLKFFGTEQGSDLPWREIIVQVHLTCGKSHCILLQLLDPLTHQVRHADFTPEARPVRQETGVWWSTLEDEKLMALKCQGWRVRQIYESNVLQGRSEAGLNSRAKLLVQRYKKELKTHAQKEVELWISRPSADKGTISFYLRNLI